jgi:hypothetical protein
MWSRWARKMGRYAVLAPRKQQLAANGIPDACFGWSETIGRQQSPSAYRSWPIRFALYLGPEKIFCVLQVYQVHEVRGESFGSSRRTEQLVARLSLKSIWQTAPRG